MAPLRLIDVLKKAEAFHRDLSHYYQSHIAETKDEQIRVLLDYLSRHEAYLQHCLEEYEHGASRGVLEAWFKVSPDLRAFPRIEKFRFGADLTSEELVELGLDLDRFLISVYRELIERSISTPLREALTDLLEMEQREEIKVMRGTLSV
ncbi:MAG: hypothetical protein AMXMBFR82_44080 [Candidatus Hydrogenedentota bacterium]